MEKSYRIYRAVLSFILLVVLAMILVFIGNDEEIRTVKAVTIETFGQNVQTSEKDTDITKPTLNASVSNGVLNIQVYDENSGVKAIYVNGYEFTEVINGRLTIRLQQFDVGYEYFYISAMDNARNLSEMYKIKNPYYSSLEGQENLAQQLPISAEATKPSVARGIVTEHIQMKDSKQNTKTVAQVKQPEVEENTKTIEGGKEFYTIQTVSGKVFYLIIDKGKEEEVVYFLTEIDENDLLNVTTNNSETLPKNSAVLESTIPFIENALPNQDSTNQIEELPNLEDNENTKGTEQIPEIAKEANPIISYVLIGGLAVAFIIGAYYFKVVRKKKEKFVEDEDEDEDEEEVFETEEEEIDTEEDFFDDDKER